MPFISAEIIAKIGRRFERADWPDQGEVVVFDLEYTAWEGSLARSWSEDWEYQEIVQIGAVRLEASGALVEKAAFDCFIRPTFNPDLSDYFTGLTGITEADLARHGEAFELAFGRFHDFLDGAELVLANGMDAALLKQNCVWRDHDWAFEEHRFCNLRRFLAGSMGISPGEATSSHLPAILGLEVGFDPHTGLGDARAISAALRAIRRDGKL